MCDLLTAKYRAFVLPVIEVDRFRKIVKHATQKEKDGNVLFMFHYCTPH